MLRRIGLLALAAMLALGMLLATSGAFANPPGPGSKQCTPGQNNVGG